MSNSTKKRKTPYKETGDELIGREVYFKMSKKDAKGLMDLTPGKLYKIVKVSMNDLIIINDDIDWSIEFWLNNPYGAIHLNCKAHWILAKKK